MKQEEVDTSFVEQYGQVDKTDLLSQVSKMPKAPKGKCYRHKAGSDKLELVDISDEFQGAIDEMRQPANRLLSKFRLDKMSKDKEDCFLDIEAVLNMRQAIERGDETYPINLKEYKSNMKAQGEEHDFLMNELNKALFKVELIKEQVAKATSVGSHPNTIILREIAVSLKS